MFHVSLILYLHFPSYLGAIWLILCWSGVKSTKTKCKQAYIYIPTLTCHLFVWHILMCCPANVRDSLTCMFFGTRMSWEKWSVVEQWKKCVHLESRNMPKTKKNKKRQGLLIQAGTWQTQSTEEKISRVFNIMKHLRVHQQLVGMKWQKCKNWRGEWIHCHNTMVKC